MGADWLADHADGIRRAMATTGGHLFIGPHGYTLHYAKGATLRGFDVGRMKRDCLLAGLPVIDARALDFEQAFALACRSPMIAVGEPPHRGPWRSESEAWGPLAHAPLSYVAGLYRAAGAEVMNLPCEDVA